ncbi:BrnT family toxin [Chamaesiphon sp.]|uniref:BrnT family toxin n=1 Tax=Chamaesiphon sp. TaxID=2814140 RepID=UPI003593B2C1
MSLQFEWDEQKAELNAIKHGVSFEEFKTVFVDLCSITIDDLEHSIEENRYIDIGISDRGRLLVVVYTERGDSIRIISSRCATNREIRIYEQD